MKNLTTFIYISTQPDLKQIGKPELTSPDSVCAMTGQPIQSGYKRKKIISVASADIADTFRARSDWISPEAAQLYKSSALLRGNLLILPDNYYRPFISNKSATEDRPCWRDIIADEMIDTDTQAVAIFTDESKRRLWPNATISTYGANWKPYFNAAPYKGAPAESRTLDIHTGLLVNCLSTVEEIYNLGFPKILIANILFCVSANKLIKQYGGEMVKKLDERLSLWRGTDEFLLALFIAQKFK